jgi:hypothetical protein
VVLEVEALQLKRNGPVSRFRLRRGEILGFAGLVGSGRTETVLAMLGAHPAVVQAVHARCAAALPIRRKPASGDRPAAGKPQGAGTHHQLSDPAQHLAEQLRQVPRGGPVPGSPR